ncbi:unnamed protein product [Mytilus coruscus]|uniref:Transposase Helix-turn-helix domain-containing protein n=1 Tax=Mytilus coruscus TaxID=42192 RepID=A0A6J8AMC3_MYTCO|nr:unnamed protein product [Mytilus coruscus]
MRKYLMARNNLLLMNRRSNLQPAERRIWSKPRSRNWWDCIVPGFTDEEWIQNFRINKETFDFLKENLHDTLVKCDTPFRKALTVDLKIASTLWKLASNCEYRTVAHLFGIARSTPCSVFHDVVTNIKRNYVKLKNNYGLKNCMKIELNQMVTSYILIDCLKMI